MKRQPISRLVLTGALVLAGIARSISAAEHIAPLSEAPAGKGRDLYAQHCFACHQESGEGVPGIFPPLARSDYLMADKARSIRVLCDGLSGKIIVNGIEYNGRMPPVLLDDSEIAAVLTYVRNNWGNAGGPVSADEVRRERAKTKFATFGGLMQAHAYPPLPPAPAGFRLREVAQLPDLPTRLASDGTGRTLYVLCQGGDVWHVEVATGALRRLLRAADYIDVALGQPMAAGLTLDAQKLLYIVVNQRIDAGKSSAHTVTIFRTAGFDAGEPANPRPWLRNSTPGRSNHGASHIAFGPDGALYVTSGSRTDSNEPTRRGAAIKGETPLSACIWRIDPKADSPKIEVFARGLRNAYGFCWNERGEMFATENGPHADCPEELNLIERGKHYGFPFRFSNWDTKPYPHTPDAPAGLELTLPIANLGPAGKSGPDPLYTFDPHASPAGMVYLGDDFPEGWRGGLLVAQFGNMLRSEVHTGFDLLLVKLKRNARAQYEAHTTTVLAPLARPLDVHLGGNGRVFICEYSRGTKSTMPMTSPGRILELAVNPN